MALTASIIVPTRERAGYLDVALASIAPQAAAAGAELLFVDDDVAVRPGWLAALLDAERRAEPDVGVLTGPIHARFEDHHLRSCGREGPPITSQDHGPADRDVAHAWGAN